MNRGSIITISGRPGSGKSVVAKALAKKLNMKRYCTGEFMRAMAKQRGVSLLALSEEAKHDNGKIDRAIDDFQIRLGETKNNFVIDGRLGFHFIPHSVKIFLEVNPNVAAKRIFRQQRRGVETIRTMKEAQKELKKRFGLERVRYKKYYGVDYMDKKNYDVVIDTTKNTIDGVVKRILTFLKEKGKRR